MYTSNITYTGRLEVMGKLRETWTEEDVRLLEEMYSVWPPRYELLPLRSRKTIHQQAHLRGFTLKARQPDHTTATETEWAYLAGIIDGEGTIGLYGPGPRSPHGRAFVVIANSNTDLLNWVQQLWPGCTVSLTLKAGDLRKGQFTTHKSDIYQLRWTRRAAIKSVLEGILPYLRIKKDRAEKVLAWVAERKEYQ
jgi:hypothetical protein